MLCSTDIFINNPSRLRSSGRKPNPSFTASEGFLMFLSPHLKLSFRTWGG